MRREDDSFGLVLQNDLRAFMHLRMVVGIRAIARMLVQQSRQLRDPLSRLVKKLSVASHNCPSWSQPMFRGTNEPTHMGGRDDATNSSWLINPQTQSNKKYPRQWLAMFSQF